MRQKIYWWQILGISTIPENFIKIECKRDEKSIIFRKYRFYFGSKNSNLAPKNLKTTPNFKSIGLKDDEIWIFLWKTHFLSFRAVYGAAPLKLKFSGKVFFLCPNCGPNLSPIGWNSIFFYEQQDQSEEWGRKGCQPPKTWCSRGFSHSARPKEENEPN